MFQVLHARKCSHCNNSLALGSHLCPNCGTVVPRPSPKELGTVAVALGLFAVVIYLFETMRT
jgi:hypothetical protein